MTMTEARPRWGTFSVKSHLDLDALTLDVLLYDALVFPTPWDDEEEKRWNNEGWDTSLLALRIAQLGDLAFTAPWSPAMHGLWYEEFRRRSAVDPDDPNLAFSLTAEMMAEHYFADLVGPRDDRVGRLQEPPELVPAFADRNLRKHAKSAWAELIAAYQDVGQARKLHRVTPLGDPSPTHPLAGHGLAVRFDVAAPVTDGDEGVFLEAVKLADDEEFQGARRRLWAWEQDRKDYNRRDLAFALERLVADYNAQVERHFPRTLKRGVLYVVPLALGVLVDVTMTGGVGTAVGLGLNLSVDAVKAKFPQLSEAAAPLAHHPGSAVARAVSVLAHK